MSVSFICSKAGCIPRMLCVIFAIPEEQGMGKKGMYTFRTIKGIAGLCICNSKCTGWVFHNKTGFYIEVKTNSSSLWPASSLFLNIR